MVLAKMNNYGHQSKGTYASYKFQILISFWKSHSSLSHSVIIIIIIIIIFIIIIIIIIVIIIIIIIIIIVVVAVLFIICFYSFIF